MKRQPFCALPWCGKTGKIDMHHIKRRSQGGGDEDSNLVPLCHECHMAHHDGRTPLEFRSGTARWRSSDGVPSAWYALAEYNEFDQSVPFDDSTEDEGDAVHAITAQLKDFASTANTLDYYVGRVLLELSELLTAAEMKLLVEETFGLSPKSVPSFISRRKKIAKLDEQYASLGLTKLLLLAEAVEKSDQPIESLAIDLNVLSADDFAAAHCGKTPAAEKARCECPKCGRTHVCEGEKHE